MDNEEKIAELEICLGAEPVTLNVVRETLKAMLVEYQGKETWLPKKLVDMCGDGNEWAMKTVNEKLFPPDEAAQEVRSEVIGEIVDGLKEKNGVSDPAPDDIPF